MFLDWQIIVTCRPYECIENITENHITIASKTIGSVKNHQTIFIINRLLHYSDMNGFVEEKKINRKPNRRRNETGGIRHTLNTLTHCHWHYTERCAWQQQQTHTSKRITSILESRWVDGWQNGKRHRTDRCDTIMLKGCRCNIYGQLPTVCIRQSTKHTKMKTISGQMIYGCNVYEIIAQASPHDLCIF